MSNFAEKNYNLESRHELRLQIGIAQLDSDILSVKKVRKTGVIREERKPNPYVHPRNIIEENNSISNSYQHFQQAFQQLIFVEI